MARRLGRVGEVFVPIVGNLKPLKESLEKGKGVASRGGKAIANAAKLAAVGAAAGAAVGVAAVAGLTQKYRDLNNELKPFAARIGAGEAELDTLRKVAERVGSEDGLEGITDSAQELGIRLNDMAIGGAKDAAAALEELGLSQEELRKKSPKDAMLELFAALQTVENQSERNHKADLLLGGASEKVAGILALTGGEFAKLREEEGQHEEATQRSIDAAKKLDASMGSLKRMFEGILANVAPPVINFLTGLIEKGKEYIPLLKGWYDQLATKLMPVWNEQLKPGLKEVWRILNEDLLPAIQSFTQAVGPHLMPVLMNIAKFLKGTLSGAILLIKGLILILAGVLSGDFSKAWEGVQLVATAIVNQLINIAEFLANSIIGTINSIIKAAAAAIRLIPGMGGLADKLSGLSLGKVSLGRMEAPKIPSLPAHLGNPSGLKLGQAVPGFKDIQRDEFGLPTKGGLTVVHQGDNYGTDDLGEMIRDALNEGEKQGI